MKLDNKNTNTQFFELIVSCSFEAWKIIRKEKKLLISSVPCRSKFVALLCRIYRGTAELNEKTGFFCQFNLHILGFKQTRRDHIEITQGT